MIWLVAGTRQRARAAHALGSGHAFAKRHPCPDPAAEIWARYMGRGVGRQGAAHCLRPAAHQAIALALFKRPALTDPGRRVCQHGGHPFQRPPANPSTPCKTRPMRCGAPNALPWHCCCWSRQCLWPPFWRRAACGSMAPRPWPRRPWSVRWPTGLRCAPCSTACRFRSWHGTLPSFRATRTALAATWRALCASAFWTPSHWPHWCAGTTWWRGWPNGCWRRATRNCWASRWRACCRRRSTWCRTGRWSISSAGRRAR